MLALNYDQAKGKKRQRIVDTESQEAPSYVPEAAAHTSLSGPGRQECPNADGWVISAIWPLVYTQLQLSWQKDLRLLHAIKNFVHVETGCTETTAHFLLYHPFYQVISA